jgi:hypothetical protein
MLAARITFAHLAAAVGVRGDDLKRSATDAGDTLVTGALHSRCQLLANAPPSRAIAQSKGTAALQWAPQCRGCAASQGGSRNAYASEAYINAAFYNESYGVTL